MIDSTFDQQVECRTKDTLPEKSSGELYSIGGMQYLTNDATGVILDLINRVTYTLSDRTEKPMGNPDGEQDDEE